MSTTLPSDTTLYGVDSFGSLAAAAPCLARNHAFAMRYYAHNPDKKMTREEAQALSAAGLWVGAVWEVEADIAYFGAGQGSQDGKDAFEYASGMVGQPLGSTVYFSVDNDADEAQIRENVVPYFEAVAAASNPGYVVGVYGSGLVCSTVKQAGLAAKSWLSQSTGYLGYDPGGDHEIVQMPGPVQGILECGVRVDGNRILPGKNPGLFQIE